MTMTESIFNKDDPEFQLFLSKIKTSYTKELCELILKDCKPFLTATKSYRKPLFLMGNGFASIPPVIRDSILYWQHQHFGFCQPPYFTILNKTKLGKILERVTTYVSYTTSKSLSEETIYAFPIGDFKFFWSPLVPSINLLFKNIIFEKPEKGQFLTSLRYSSRLKSVINSHAKTISLLQSSTIDSEIVQATLEILSDLDYRNTEFYSGYNSGNELQFSCLGFYLAKSSEINEDILKTTLRNFKP